MLLHYLVKFKTPKKYYSRRIPKKIASSVWMLIKVDQGHHVHWINLFGVLYCNPCMKRFST